MGIVIVQVPAVPLERDPTPFDIPMRWNPRANESPAGAFIASLCAATLFKSRLAHMKKDTHSGVFFHMGQPGLEPGTKRL